VGDKGAPLPAAEEELLRRLHAEHGPALQAYATRLCGGDRMRAEDAVQETLLRAWRAAPSLDPERGSLRSWLFTTCRRIVIDIWRVSPGRHEDLTETLPERPSEDELDQALTTWQMLDVLAELSPAHREVILHCYYYGRTTTQAAEALGVPVGTVKSRLFYAIRLLRLLLQERGVVQA
jgi:RNA polymerase sigma-70 factor (ECF subfamily)